MKVWRSTRSCAGDADLNGFRPGPSICGNEKDPFAGIEGIEGKPVFSDFDQGKPRVERLKKGKNLSAFEPGALEKFVKWHGGHSLVTLGAADKGEYRFAGSGPGGSGIATRVSTCDRFQPIGLDGFALAGQNGSRPAEAGNSPKFDEGWLILI